MLHPLYIVFMTLITIYATSQVLLYTGSNGPLSTLFTSTPWSEMEEMTSFGISTHTSLPGAAMDHVDAYLPWLAPYVRPVVIEEKQASMMEKVLAFKDDKVDTIKTTLHRMYTYFMDPPKTWMDRVLFAVSGYAIHAEVVTMQVVQKDAITGRLFYRQAMVLVEPAEEAWERAEALKLDGVVVEIGSAWMPSAMWSVLAAVVLAMIGWVAKSAYPTLKKPASSQGNIALTDPVINGKEIYEEPSLQDMAAATPLPISDHTDLIIEDRSIVGELEKVAVCDMMDDDERPLLVEYDAHILEIKTCQSIAESAQTGPTEQAFTEAEADYGTLYSESTPLAGQSDPDALISVDVTSSRCKSVEDILPEAADDGEISKRVVAQREGNSLSFSEAVRHAVADALAEEDGVSIGANQVAAGDTNVNRDVSATINAYSDVDATKEDLLTVESERRADVDVNETSPVADGVEARNSDENLEPSLVISSEQALEPVFTKDSISRDLFSSDFIGGSWADMVEEELEYPANAGVTSIYSVDVHEDIQGESSFASSTGYSGSQGVSMPTSEESATCSPPKIRGRGTSLYGKDVEAVREAQERQDALLRTLIKTYQENYHFNRKGELMRDVSKARASFAKRFPGNSADPEVVAQLRKLELELFGVLPRVLDPEAPPTEPIVSVVRPTDAKPVETHTVKAERRGKLMGIGSVNAILLQQAKHDTKATSHSPITRSESQQALSPPKGGDTPPMSSMQDAYSSMWSKSKPTRPTGVIWNPATPKTPKIDDFTKPQRLVREQPRNGQMPGILKLSQPLSTLQQGSLLNAGEGNGLETSMWAS